MKKFRFIFEFVIIICCVRCVYRDNSNDPLSPLYLPTAKVRIDSISIWQNSGFYDTMDQSKSHYYDTVSFFIVYTHDTGAVIAKYNWNFDGNRLDSTLVSYNSQVYHDTGWHWVQAVMSDSHSDTLASFSDSFFVGFPSFL